jgi:RHS repeat-associated protein
MQYDALNRIKRLTYPQDVENRRRELRPQYNRAGALEQVTLDDAPYVKHIAYNAKGQRLFIAYGNDAMTRHAYDPKTFRLVRLRTEGYTKPAGTTYRPAGSVRQDFAYSYDLVGNIWQIHDRTPQSGILGQDALDREFNYDPLYRLRSATGRETDFPPYRPWDETPRITDFNRARGYTESYIYDEVGNIKVLSHAASGGGFTRRFTLATGSNRLNTVAVGTTTFRYRYDDNGNMTEETTSRHFEWDHSDRMRVFRTQPAGGGASLHAHYLYDAGGQRLKKLVRNQGGQVNVTVYIDDVFEHHRSIQGGTVSENNSLHVMDNQSRIALVRVGTPFPDDATPTAKYHLGDHLRSSNVVIGGANTFINREEYTPYGETSFGSFAKKRYRFTGKERDEESGLYYFGARFYAPWLGRWLACDPKGAIDGTHLYGYCRCAPFRLTDPSGEATQPDINQQISTLEEAVEKHESRVNAIEQGLKSVAEDVTMHSQEFNRAKTKMESANQRTQAGIEQAEEGLRELGTARNRLLTDLDRVRELEEQSRNLAKEGVRLGEALEPATSLKAPVLGRGGPRASAAVEMAETKLYERAQNLLARAKNAFSRQVYIGEKVIPVLRPVVSDAVKSAEAVNLIRTGYRVATEEEATAAAARGSRVLRIGGTVLVLLDFATSVGEEADLVRMIQAPLELAYAGSQAAYTGAKEAWRDLKKSVTLMQEYRARALMGR